MTFVPITDISPRAIHTAPFGGSVADAQELLQEYRRGHGARLAVAARFRANLGRPGRKPASRPSASAAAASASHEFPVPAASYDRLFERYSGPLRLMQPANMHLVRSEVRRHAKLAEKSGDGRLLKDSEREAYQRGQALGRRYGQNPRWAACALGYRVVVNAPQSLRKEWQLEEQCLAVFNRPTNALLVFDGVTPECADGLLAHELGHARDPDLDRDRSNPSAAWAWDHPEERRAQAFAIGFVGA